jgi:hypothetical protein
MNVNAVEDVNNIISLVKFIKFTGFKLKHFLRMKKFHLVMILALKERKSWNVSVTIWNRDSTFVGATI